jgi:hypothetical protein
MNSKTMLIQLTIKLNRVQFRTSFFSDDDYEELSEPEEVTNEQVRIWFESSSSREIRALEREPFPTLNPTCQHKQSMRVRDPHTPACPLVALYNSPQDMCVTLHLKSWPFLPNESALVVGREGDLVIGRNSTKHPTTGVQ